VSRLSHVTQVGTAHNPNSYVQAIPNSSTSTFIALFTFHLPVTRRNTLNVRGIELQLNLRQISPSTDQVWQIDWFNPTSQEFEIAGVFDGSIDSNWQGGSLLLQGKSVSEYVNIRRQVVIRLSSNGTSDLWMDQVAISIWLPNYDTNQALRQILRII